MNQPTRGPDTFGPAFVFGLRRRAPGWLALRPTRGSRLDHLAIATLGIRGLGTVFYIAYAQGHGEFEGIEAVWRIAVLAILMSIAVHGVAAQALMDRLEARGAEREAADAT